MEAFTEAEIQTLKRVLYGTWEYIGSDIMESLAAENKYSISQNDVIEVVLDANHCDKMVKELKAIFEWAKFCDMPYKDRIAFAKKHAFQAKRYA